MLSQINRLSAREKEVVALLLQGKSNQQIALALGIRERTVEFHLTNVYVKLRVRSRIELILNLREFTGGTPAANLGKSTVDNRLENAENDCKRTPPTNRASSWRACISLIGKEPQMKRRWIIYLLAGLVFGAAYWHYFSASARFFNDLYFLEDSIGQGVLLILALLTYFWVWLIPAVVPAWMEFRRSASLRLSALAVITVLVSAVLGYYSNYVAMLALVGLPHMEHLLVFGQPTATLWQDWGSIFPRLILFNFLKWTVVLALIGGVAGLVTSSLVSVLSKKSPNTATV